MAKTELANLTNCPECGGSMVGRACYDFCRCGNTQRYPTLASAQANARCAVESLGVPGADVGYVRNPHDYDPPRQQTYAVHYSR